MVDLYFFALGRLITILMKINDFYLDLCALLLSVNLRFEMCGYLWCLQLLFLIIKGIVFPKKENFNNLLVFQTCITSFFLLCKAKKKILGVCWNVQTTLEPIDC